MFRGDDAGLDRVMRRAFWSARELRHPRVGSEHLLLALAHSLGPVADILAGHNATIPALREAACAVAPWGAGAAADRDMLATLGVDLDHLLGAWGPAPLDRTAGRQPVLPLHARRARRRCAKTHPPLGIDAQAVYEASLRLALARRERRHRSEHLALALAALDPGVHRVLSDLGVDRRALVADLATAFPPPRRNPLLRAERRLGHRSRYRHIVARYQRFTGRTATDGPAVAGLIVG